MSTRDELLAHLWRAINANLDTASLAAEIARSKNRPDAPFADTGPALERLLATGADPRDICLIRREAAYAATFGTLYAIGDPGVEDDNVFMLFEELLTADPSGMEGRPGSADAVR
ncbi:hypothetical protein LDO26_11325 [Luteimonas sp. BDR2-5]|uniref:hypothetical protein n=1 Tax=Proluteimonas luteida TaxID=2878685 RepID=UPI001E450077|nr:hypothetical protein [Luteimonas sp. BDR2-5]MCD9028797.1 hypothetical protein [Luteimonas sp. BDR2-5]